MAVDSCPGPVCVVRATTSDIAPRRVRQRREMIGSPHEPVQRLVTRWSDNFCIEVPTIVRRTELLSGHRGVQRRFLVRLATTTSATHWSVEQTTSSLGLYRAINPSQSERSPVDLVKHRQPPSGGDFVQQEGRSREAVDTTQPYFDNSNCGVAYRAGHPWSQNHPYNPVARILLLPAQLSASCSERMSCERSLSLSPAFASFWISSVLRNAAVSLERKPWL